MNKPSTPLPEGTEVPLAGHTWTVHRFLGEWYQLKRDGGGGLIISTVYQKAATEALALDNLPKPL